MVAAARSSRTAAPGCRAVILLVRHAPSLEVGLEDEAIQLHESNASSDRNDRPERAAGVACLHSTDLGKGFDSSVRVLANLSLPTDSDGRAHRVVCFAICAETLAGPGRAKRGSRRIEESTSACVGISSLFSVILA